MDQSDPDLHTKSSDFVDVHERSEAPGVAAVLNTLSPAAQRAFDMQEPYSEYTARHGHLKAAANLRAELLQQLNKMIHDPNNSDGVRERMWDHAKRESKTQNDIENSARRINTERLVNVAAFARDSKSRPDIAAQVSPSHGNHKRGGDISHPAYHRPTSQQPARSQGPK